LTGTARAATLSLIVTLAIVIAWAPSWTVRLAGVWYDACQTLSPRKIVTMPATIVEIDQKSLAALGQWPWPRFVLAQLVDAIHRHRPLAIGLDILMPEPDRLSPEHLLARVRATEPELAQRLSQLPGNDAELARALAAAPSVLAVAGAFEPTGMPLRAPPFQIIARAGQGTPSPEALRVPRFAGAIASIDALDRAARGHGLISADTTRGIFRRLPLVGNIDGALVPGLAIEMLRVAVGVPSLRLFTVGDTVEAIGVGDLVAPTEADGAVRVYYSPHDSDRFVSALDVLEGRFDPAQLERKLVLVGVTGVGTVEDKITPLGVMMPGVEIHAQLIENLFDGTMLRRPPWGAPLEGAVFLALAVMLFVVTPRWKPLNAAFLAIACIAALFGIGYAAFRAQRLLLDAATPAACLLFVYGVLLVLTLTEANRHKRALERVVQRQREESARIAGELDAAKRIQMAALPRPEALHADPRVDLAAAMVPAREVGGDLYDFFLLNDHRLFLLVGDVAGKGLTASFFQAVSKALYKSTTLRAPDADAGALMTAANAEVARDNPEMLFVTAFAATLDLDTGELVYCNAGHVDPYLARRDDPAVRRITDGDGPPLCVVDDFRYTGARRALALGEWLCVVTDGVTEAQSRSGELYGGKRVENVLLRALQAEPSARAIVDALRADVDAFAAGAEPADDFTVLVLRWNGPGTGGVAGTS
jgi:serine phosphatase RsbU (regulator of sigma subunit)